MGGTAGRILSGKKVVGWTAAPLASVRAAKKLGCGKEDGSGAVGIGLKLAKEGGGGGGMAALKDGGIAGCSAVGG